ncbi:MAG: hypothetical protein HYX79_07175 [Chloroflexi bacterium]|nr:hypothetical protein [Chloroflexota bacterium]
MVVEGEDSQMRLHTCSEVISLGRKLEEESARLYEELSRRYNNQELQSFALDNKKYITQIERAYHGVISDAIEGCFAFDMESDDYNIADNQAQGTTLADALNRAIEMEHKMIRFYTDAAAQSNDLLADIPRAFRFVIGKRKSRIEKLETLRSASG